MVELYFGRLNNTILNNSRDLKIFDWILDLRNEYNDPRIIMYNATNDSLTFKREEDAIAFKLKFGM